MYHVTAESQGLSWELKVAQERQKLFLQELEERLIAPPPSAASRRHTGHTRKGTANANSPISVPSAQHAVPSTSEENSPISVPNPNRKKLRYRVAVPSTREGNSGMLALQLRIKKDGTLPTNPTDYFNFVVDTCWRANTHRFGRSSFRKCITRNKTKKATNRQLAIPIGSVTTPNG